MLGLGKELPVFMPSPPGPEGGPSCVSLTWQLWDRKVPGQELFWP